MQLILICHGETDPEAQGIALGWLDKSLNDSGKQATGQFAKFLQQQENLPDMVITSPLTRCRQTAMIIAQASGKYFIENELIKERNLGELTGKKEDPTWIETIPQGETLTDVNARLIKFLYFLIQLRNGGKYQSLMIVTHPDIVRYLLKLLQDYPDEEVKGLEVSFLSKFEIEF